MSRGYRLPVDRLERACASRGWSVTETAHHSGLGISTVSRALAGRKVSVSTLVRLAAAFTKHPPLPEVRALIGTAADEPVGRPEESA